MVVKNSKEYKTRGAQAAIANEVQKQKDHKSFDLSNVREWDDVAREDPAATRIKQKAIVSSKFEEDPSLQEYKARLILQGCGQRDTWGRIVELCEPGMASDPMRFTELRTLVYLAYLCPNGTIKQADVKSAYITSKMGGSPV